MARKLLWKLHTLMVEPPLPIKRGTEIEGAGMTSVTISAGASDCKCC